MIVEELDGVWTFERNSSTLLAPPDLGSTFRDYYGTVVTMSRVQGSTVAIRYPRITPSSSTFPYPNIGTVQLFTCCNTDLPGEDWQPLSEPLGGINQTESFDSVSIAEKSPLIIVYVRDLTRVNNAYYQVYRLGLEYGSRIDAGQEGSYFKGVQTFADISFDGEVVAVGLQERLSVGSANECQVVKAFERSSDTSSYIQMGQSISLGETDCVRNIFGGYNFELSYGGDVLAMASINGGLSRVGFVRIFTWSSGGWVQFGQDLIGVTANGQFGYSISFDETGKRVAIGEPNHAALGSIAYAGQVRIFDYNEATGLWELRSNTLVGVTGNDRFGHSVSLSLSGDRLAVGSLGNGGRVQVFEIFEQ